MLRFLPLLLATSLQRSISSAVALLLLACIPGIAAASDDQLAAVSASGPWAALIILIVSAITAWALNHRTAKVRGLGALLAALGCFALVAWFCQLSVGGVLEQPKPNQTPMDSLKPALLWMQVGVALLAGVLLLAVVYRLGRSRMVLNLPVKNEPTRYGRFSRFIHWLTAILFILMIPMGIFASMIPEDAPFRNDYYVLHKTLGVVVFALLIVRLLWNRYSTRPQLDETLKPGERKWARRVHVALYVLLIAVPVTGYVMTSLHGYGTFIFFWEVPTLLAESKAYIVWGLLHKYVLQYALYLILGAHVLGALKHFLLDKHDGAARRMLG
jgi:cytochrome b561